jgi:uncharacterized protein YcbK (DUF882 family)
MKRRNFLLTALGGGLAVVSNCGWANLAPFEARLRLFNTHTGERIDALYRDAKGEYRTDALAALDELFRCHHTGEVARMDTAMLDFLNQVSTRVGPEREIHIVSGYRSPAYNALLRERGRGVAKHSLHLEGRAVDVRIPGVRLAALHETALQLKLGGVGFYPKSDFVHLDSGRVRRW